MTITGTTAFTPVEVLAARTLLSHATTMATAHIPRERQSVMMAQATRSEWRPARNGLVVAIWTRAMECPPLTLSVSSFFLLPIRWVAHRHRAIPQKLQM